MLPGFIKGHLTKSISRSPDLGPASGFIGQFSRLGYMGDICPAGKVQPLFRFPAALIIREDFGYTCRIRDEITFGLIGQAACYSSFSFTHRYSSLSSFAGRIGSVAVVISLPLNPPASTDPQVTSPINPRPQTQGGTSFWSSTLQYHRAPTVLVNLDTLFQPRYTNTHEE